MSWRWIASPSRVGKARTANQTPVAPENASNSVGRWIDTAARYRRSKAVPSISGKASHSRAPGAARQSPKNSRARSFRKLIRHSPSTSITPSDVLASTAAMRLSASCAASRMRSRSSSAAAMRSNADPSIAISPTSLRRSARAE